MNPMGSVFRIRFVSLHANAQDDSFAFMGTSLDGVVKRNDFSERAMGETCFITQGFQLPFYPVDIVGHISKRYATGVGLSGMAMNRLSSSKLTRSSPLYLPLSPWRT